MKITFVTSISIFLLSDKMIKCWGNMLNNFVHMYFAVKVKKQLGKWYVIESFYFFLKSSMWALNIQSSFKICEDIKEVSYKWKSVRVPPVSVYYQQQIFSFKRYFQYFLGSIFCLNPVYSVVYTGWFKKKNCSNISKWK